MQLLTLQGALESMLHTKRNLCTTAREALQAATPDEDPVQLNKQTNKQKHKQVKGTALQNPYAPHPYFIFSPTLYVCWEHLKADTMYQILNTIFNCPCALKLPWKGQNLRNAQNV